MYGYHGHVTWVYYHNKSNILSVYRTLSYIFLYDNSNVPKVSSEILSQRKISLKEFFIKNVLYTRGPTSALSVYSRKCDWLGVRSPLEETKYLRKCILSFLRSNVEANLSVEFRHSTRNASRVRLHAMPPEFSRKWGTENTRFPLPTLLCAGYSVKLIYFDLFLLENIWRTRMSVNLWCTK